MVPYFISIVAGAAEDQRSGETVVDGVQDRRTDAERAAEAEGEGDQADVLSPTNRRACQILLHVEEERVTATRRSRGSSGGAAGSRWWRRPRGW